MKFITERDSLTGIVEIVCSARCPATGRLLYACMRVSEREWLGPEYMDHVHHCLREKMIRLLGESAAKHGQAGPANHVLWEAGFDPGPWDTLKQYPMITYPPTSPAGLAADTAINADAPSPGKAAKGAVADPCKRFEKAEAQSHPEDWGSIVWDEIMREGSGDDHSPADARNDTDARFEQLELE